MFLPVITTLIAILMIVVHGIFFLSLIVYIMIYLSYHCCKCKIRKFRYIEKFICILLFYIQQLFLFSEHK